MGWITLLGSKVVLYSALYAMFLQCLNHLLLFSAVRRLEDLYSYGYMFGDSVGTNVIAKESSTHIRNAVLLSVQLMVQCNMAEDEALHLELFLARPGSPRQIPTRVTTRIEPGELSIELHQLTETLHPNTTKHTYNNRDHVRQYPSTYQRDTHDFIGRFYSESQARTSPSSPPRKRPCEAHPS